MVKEVFGSAMPVSPQVSQSQAVTFPERSVISSRASGSNCHDTTSMPMSDAIHSGCTVPAPTA